jgi:hypothetical protein
MHLSNHFFQRQAFKGQKKQMNQVNEIVAAYQKWGNQTHLLFDG